VSLADRPVIRPHHQIPAKWKRIIAARAAAERAEANQSSGGSGMYLGGTTTSMSLGGTLSLSNYGSGATAVINGGNLVVNSSASLTLATGVPTAAGFVKTGVGSLALGGTLTLGTGSAAANAVNSAFLQAGASTANLTLTGTANSIPVMMSARLVLSGGGSLASSASFASFINGRSFTVAGGAGIVAVVADPLTGLNRLVVNGETLPWPDAAHPLTLVPAANTVTNPTIVTNQSSRISGGSSLVLATGTVSPVATESIQVSAPEAPEAPAPVPEPSSALLALLGAGVLSQRRR
jgi:hypothetical protein